MKPELEPRIKKAILIVEDDTTFSLLLKLRLEEEGFETIVSKNGLEALNIIQQKQFDIIISDVVMPYMTGLELMEAIIALDICIPFILISSNSQEDILLDTMNFNIDNFLRKPFNIYDLISKIKNLIY